MANKINIDGMFFIYLALSLLLIPVKWIGAWLVAAVFHELCHLIALRCFHSEMCGINIGFTGAVITSASASNMEALICEAAGPAGSFMLLLLCRVFPTVAICGFIQGSFNLLPLYPLDGSRILDRFLSLFLPEKHKRIASDVIWFITALLLFIGGVFLYRMSLGPIPVVAVLILIWRSRKNSLQKRL